MPKKHVPEFPVPNQTSNVESICDILRMSNWVFSVSSYTSVKILEEDWPGKGKNTEVKIKYTDTEIPQKKQQRLSFFALRTLILFETTFYWHLYSKGNAQTKRKTCGLLLLVGQHKFEKKQEVKSTTPRWGGNTFLFLFLQLLPILGLGPLKGFLSCHGALQKP